MPVVESGSAAASRPRRAAARTSATAAAARRRASAARRAGAGPAGRRPRPRSSTTVRTGDRLAGADVHRPGHVADAAARPGRRRRPRRAGSRGTCVPGGALGRLAREQRSRDRRHQPGRVLAGAVEEEQPGPRQAQAGDPGDAQLRAARSCTGRTASPAASASSNSWQTPAGGPVVLGTGAGDHGPPAAAPRRTRAAGAATPRPSGVLRRRPVYARASSPRRGAAGASAAPRRAAGGLRSRRTGRPAWNRSALPVSPSTADRAERRRTRRPRRRGQPADARPADEPGRPGDEQRGSRRQVRQGVVAVGDDAGVARRPAMPRAGSSHRTPRASSGRYDRGHLVEQLGVVGQRLEPVGEPGRDVDHAAVRRPSARPPTHCRYVGESGRRSDDHVEGRAAWCSGPASPPACGSAW